MSEASPFANLATKAETARELQSTPFMVKRLIEQGDLQEIPVGRRRLISRRSIAELRKRLEAAAAA